MEIDKNDGGIFNFVTAFGRVLFVTMREIKSSGNARDPDNDCPIEWH